MDAPTLSKNKSYWFGEGSSKNVKISNVMEIEKAQRRFARRGKKLMKISLDEGHFPYEKMSTTFGSHLEAKDMYVVTEKVHGANFCFVTDGRKIEVASRKRILNPFERDFFGCFESGLVKRHESLVIDTFHRVREMHGKDVRVVWVFGELFGGGYPGKKSDQTLVQSGIFYTPTLEFIAFDICYSSDTNMRTYLSYDEAYSLWEKELGGMFVQALMRGDFETCMKHPVEFDTTIPKRFGLPAVPSMLEKNRAEGVVVRVANVAETLDIEMDTTKKLRGRRKMMKRKYSGFAEIAYGERSKMLKSYVTSSSSSSIRSNRRRDIKKTKPSTQLVWYEIFARLTTARVDSAISKTGSKPCISKTPARNTTHARMRKRLHANRVKQWMDEIFALVVEDLEEELSAEFKSLSLTERNRLLSDARDVVKGTLKEREEGGNF
eukprot:g7197.t1